LSHRDKMLDSDIVASRISKMPQTRLCQILHLYPIKKKDKPL
jgi:hypothetical protein